MKTILSVLLFLPFIGFAQVEQNLGNNNTIIVPRKALKIPADSLGWGNIRIKNDTFQVKLNGVWVSPSAGGGNFLPKTFSSAQTVNTKGFSLDIANVDGSGDGYIYLSANEGRGTSILLIDTSAYISAENVYFDGMKGSNTYVGLDSFGKLMRLPNPSGGSVFAKNGVRKQGDTVKLGLELSPPFTNGLITEPTYIVSGDAPSGVYTGITYLPESETPLILGGRIDDTNLNITYGDNAGNGNGLYFDVGDDTKQNRVEMLPNKIVVGSNNGSTNYEGLVYVSNYDSSFNSNDRSIPDVGWVKSKSSVDTTIKIYTTTVNASPTTLATIPISNGDVWDIQLRGLARNSPDEAAKFLKTAIVSNNSGTVSLLDGGLVDIIADMQTSGMTMSGIDLVPSGSNLLVVATGISSTVDWKIYLTINKLP